MAEKFDKQLKAAQGLWAAAKAKAETAKRGQFTEFEDGRYLARLVGGTIGKSQSSGRLQVTWTFKFEEGEYEGQNKLDFSGLETEQNLYYLGLRFRDLGYELPDSIADIQAVLDDVAQTKPLCKIRLKTKGEFQNLFIDKVFGPGDEAGAEGADSDDGEPAAPPAEEEEPEKAEEEETEEEETEEEPEEEDADSVDIQPGMPVVVESAKGKVRGEVLEILEAEGKVRVKCDDGRVLRVTADKLSAVVDEPPAKPKAAPKKGKK